MLPSQIDSPSDTPTADLRGCAVKFDCNRRGAKMPSAEVSASAELLSQWANSEATFPPVGSTFIGFHIERELGRGAFGRVYLARQGDLAGRPVALKIACDSFSESQTLAQLQHTNIVPIYSFHRAEPFQAVCMPYYGRTTLAEVIGHLRGRASLPSSGRELRSTVAHHSTAEIPSASSASAFSNAQTPHVLPALPAPPAAPIHVHDGWAQLEGVSFVEAVLIIAGQLADGLVHAHARGILHRDLKPANVLLTDDGRPMLLDFNLAEDTKTRTDAERAAIGGTLPYMAPEQIRAFRDKTGTLDARCDLYSLGVILFELLTGRHPFPARRGFTGPVLAELLADRERGAPSVRLHNRAVSPAVDAIVQKCLAPHPSERYQHADELREDIDRHLSHLPLLHAPNPSWRERAVKWGRRHPRLASSGTVAGFAVVFLSLLGAGTAYSWDHSRDLHARAVFADHRSEFVDVQLFLDDRNQSRPHLDEALNKLHAILGRYGVSPEGSDDWLQNAEVRRLSESDRVQLRGDVGETFYLMAQVAYLRALGSDDQSTRTENLERASQWNGVAARLAGDRLPHALREQRIAIAELHGSRSEVDRLRAETGRIPPDSPRDLYLLGAMLTQQGHHRAALPHLQKSTYLDPKNFSAWFVRGTVHLALDHNDEAVACFTACLALRDDFAPAWRNRGLARTKLRAFKEACDDFTRAIALDPRNADVYIQRAFTRDAEGNLAEAENDLTRSLEAGGAPVRVRLLRASIRQRRNNPTGAQADREEGLQLTPTDEPSWVARGVERLASDPQGALADAEEALKLNPFSVSALQLKAHILGERLDRRDEALAVLDRAVELHPDHVPLRAGRGVELARRGKRDRALQDAREALLRDTRPANLYQVGCIYALTSATHPEDKKEAFHLIWSALKNGFGFDLIETDSDLDSLRKDPEFAKMIAAARARRAMNRD